MKMAVFWVVAPCSLVEVYQRFRGPCYLHHQSDSPDFIKILGIDLQFKNGYWAETTNFKRTHLYSKLE
jgi:hypothetical protein